MKIPNTINQELTSVQVLGEGHGALVEAVSELHPDPEFDQVRHLDNKINVTALSWMMMNLGQQLDDGVL